MTTLAIPEGEGVLVRLGATEATGLDGGDGTISVIILIAGLGAEEEEEVSWGEEVIGGKSAVEERAGGGKGW